jgi:Zn-dependent protease
MTNILFEIATWLVPLTIAIVFHEVAHGRMAHALGDPTAAELGRLSLNPIRHVDPFGTVILPMILAVSGAPIFGWAKPVPFNPTRLRDPRWGSVLVAAAGPASNIVLALVGALGVALAAKSLGAEEGSTMASVIIGNLSNFIAINLFLAVFNMIPLPPFDGSKVLAGFLPDGWRQSFQNQRLDHPRQAAWAGFDPGGRRGQARAARRRGYGKVKVGHGGTLDPLASGVLPIALGEATKLCGRMLDSQQEYEFTIQFGAETDTLDLEGKVVAESDGAAHAG